MEINDVELSTAAQEILSRMPAMTVRNFAKALFLMSGYSSDRVMKEFRLLSKRGTILVSENGYVTTKQALDMVAAKPLRVKMDGMFRLDNLVLRKPISDANDCLPVVFDFYPYSREFYFGTGLYPISFVHTEKNCLFEVIRIPAGQSTTYRGLILKSALEEKKVKYWNDTKKTIRRIAVVDDKSCAAYVPYCGFIAICTPDPEGPEGFRIIEKRKEDIWKDVEGLA